MTSPEFGFFFEEAGRSGYEGPNNPSAEYFTGREPSEAIARELIQNALDARLNGSTVRVNFHLSQVQTSEIPGIDGLRTAMRAALTDAETLQGVGGLKDALAVANEESVWVLAISDHGTKGLTGSESIDDEKSPLSILTRGTGASAGEDGRGGSFGIGSAVGPMASRMSTVFYRTLRRDDRDIVATGYTRLATHHSNGVRRRGEGFYTRLHAQDFEYPRNQIMFPEFPLRQEPGTDVFVLAYRDAEYDAMLHRVRRAVASNFFAAVSERKLEVNGTSPSGSWTLDSDTLLSTLQEDENLRSETLPFYRALQDEKPTVGLHPALGEYRLYLYEDSDLNKAMGTMTMRQPLMRIDTFVHRIPRAYAAVLVCDADSGNELLRGIEPPEHTKWNSHGPRSNAAIVRHLKDFTRDALRERLGVQSSETARVKGLEKFLPLVSPTAGEGTGTGKPADAEDSTDLESGKRVGMTLATYEVPADQQKSFRASVRRPAIADQDADSPIHKGKDAGGAGEDRQGRGGDMTGTGAQGEGTSRIHAGSVKFRSFQPQGSEYSVLVLRTGVDAEGDLPLATLGSDGGEEANDLSIARAFLVDGLDRKELESDGLTLKNVAILAGTANRIEVSFNTGRAYRLAVKHG
ncbi:hypothetical protein LL946_00100 [Knoellia locipacati]|uniref:hypothetical protein n=1 Tax=Knoellia locipacati TaxID=882824 RepID=UPI0038513222